MLSALSRYRWLVSIAGAVVLALAVGAGLGWREQHRSESVARTMTGGNPARAPAAIRRYGCAGCHTIPGIPGGDGQVGGPLADIVHRVYVGGVVTNSPDNLVKWIVSPQAFSPRSAMPATGISEAEARDVAAYLYSR
jgi:cytochrome c2